jgi:hypothetical protein
MTSALFGEAGCCGSFPNGRQSWTTGITLFKMVAKIEFYHSNQPQWSLGIERKYHWLRVRVSHDEVVKNDC